MDDFQAYDMTGKVLLSITIPVPASGAVFNSYRMALRHHNSHPIVNAAFTVSLDSKNVVVGTPSLVFGGIEDHAIHASQTEAVLSGADITSLSVLQQACQVLQKEIQPNSSGGRIAYRQSLALSYFYQFILALQPSVPT